MAAVTICSDFGAQKNKVWHCFHCFPIYLPWSDGTMIFVFWTLSFKPTFSLFSFTFVKRLFSSSLLSAIRVVSICLGLCLNSTFVVAMQVFYFVCVCVCVVNGIAFLIWFLDCSLLVYRNAINFCILILYPSTLLNSCISFNRFFCVCRYEFLRIFYMKNPSSANRDDFTSFLQSGYLFASLLFLV